MKIILTCGDKINIPDGCKAEIKDGVITIEKEPKFKDGDIFFNDGVIGIYRNGGGDRIFYHCALMDVRLFLGENKPSYFGWDEDARLATDEEKERLFDALKLKCLHWNAEKKKIEKIRWRAEKEGSYFLITPSLKVVTVEENGHSIDDDIFSVYNYFRTQEQAEEAAELVKATLRKFHEDYGSNK